MKKTWLLLGVLVGLALFYFAFVYDKGDSSLCKESIEFAIEDTDAITQIRMTRMMGEEAAEDITLERLPNGNWIYNGGYNALEVRVEMLLETLRLLSVRRTLNDASQQRVSAIMAKNHVFVEVSGADGPIRSFQVGPQTKDYKGTIMLMKGDLPLLCEAVPQVVHIPGSEGYLNARFTINFEQWLENLIFQATPEDLQSIEVSYATGDSSFQLVKQENAWTLAGEEKQNNEAAIGAYLNAYQGKVYAESFADKYFPTLMDSLKRRDPDIVFSLTYTDESNRRVFLFKRPENLNNYFAWIEGEGQLITIQRFVFDKFLKKKEAFVGTSL